MYDKYFSLHHWEDEGYPLSKFQQKFTQVRFIINRKKQWHKKEKKIGYFST